MVNKKAKIISSLTGELHDDITNIYEYLMDEEINEGITLIDKTIAKLRHLKSNVTIKEN